MRLWWHMVAKDVRRMRWLLMIYWATYVSESLAGFWFARFGDGSFISLDRTDAVFTWVAVARGVALYLLSGLVLLEDRATAANVFWRTRPIRPSHLIAAKLGALVLIGVVLPFMITLPWWLAARLGFADLLWTAWMFLFPNLLIVLVGAAVAVVAGDGARFILWSPVAAVGCVVVLSVHLAWSGSDYRQSTSPWDWEPGVTLRSGIALATAVCVIASRYARQRWSVSMLITLCGLCLVAAPFGMRASLWRWNRGDEPLPVCNASLRFESARLVEHRSAGRPVRSLFLYLQVDGLPPGWGIDYEWPYRVRLFWPDGVEFVERGKGRHALENALVTQDALDVADARKRETRVPVVVVVPDDVAARIQREAPSAEIAVALSMAQGRRSQPISLAAGGGMARVGQARILNLEAEPWRAIRVPDLSQSPISEEPVRRYPTNPKELRRTEVGFVDLVAPQRCTWFADEWWTRGRRYLERTGFEMRRSGALAESRSDIREIFSRGRFARIGVVTASLSLSELRDPVADRQRPPADPDALIETIAVPAGTLVRRMTVPVLNVTDRSQRQETEVSP